MSCSKDQYHIALKIQLETIAGMIQSVKILAEKSWPYSSRLKELGEVNKQHDMLVRLLRAHGVASQLADESARYMKGHQ